MDDQRVGRLLGMQLVLLRQLNADPGRLQQTAQRLAQLQIRYGDALQISYVQREPGAIVIDFVRTA